MPQDDGAASTICAGLKLPSVSLQATDGTQVELSKLKGRTVVYIYPRTGVPAGRHPMAGTRSRAHADALRSPAHSATILPSSSSSASRSSYGLSTQDSRLPARSCRAIASAVSGIYRIADLRSRRPIKLPTFTWPA
jgi:hypothetical protein